MDNNSNTSNFKLTARLLFRLLPVQILLNSISAINGIVTGFFASNYVGEAAMGAVGLYNPICQLVGAISFMLLTGSVVICGKYMGKNQVGQMQNVFTLDILLCTIISAVTAAILIILAIFDLTSFIAPENSTRLVFNRFLLGQALGIFPLFIGNQLAAFLSLENKSTRTTIASIVYIVVNLIFNYVFVQVLHLQALGLAIASSLGMWVFMLVQAQFFFTPQASIRLNFKGFRWDDAKEIVTIGFPGAIGNGYQTIRGLIVNGLIISYVGNVGISAFAASNAIMAFFWAIPAGMLNVSRMMMSVSIGEEDRTTLKNVMMTALFRFIPLQCAVSAFIILMAKPFTLVFFQNQSEPVFAMTMWGYRILPLCMPFSVWLMHFSCYALASERKVLVHIYSILDGWIFVSAFAALLIPYFGMNAVYYANVLNGIACMIVVIMYAVIKNKKIPSNLDELMVIPEDFGVDDDHRVEFAVRKMEDVTGTADTAQKFCISKGIDKRRAYFISLAMEEMAGNVVRHGFALDGKKHNLTARVIVKDEDVILCIKDDCQPFDPVARQRLADPDDKTTNIGLRMVYNIAKDFTYQNVLGLNVLTIKI